MADLVRPGELATDTISKCESATQRCRWLEQYVPFCNRYQQVLKQPGAYAVRLELCIFQEKSDG